MRERVQDLGRGLDRVAVAELSAAQRLAQRAALDVLVGDVDVAAVAAEVVGAHAALVAKPRGGLHLAGGARGALALARDDLERDLEPGALVAGEPDGAGPAPAERPEGPVAVEDEVGSRKGVRGARHGHRHFAAVGDLPSGPKHGVDSARPLREQHAVSSHDDDILDFDFFDDDATREAPGAGRADAPQRPSGGGGGGGPRRPQFHAPHGVTPILRLIGFVAFAILIVVLLVLWAQGCSGDKKRNDYSTR